MLILITREKKIIGRYRSVTAAKKRLQILKYSNGEIDSILENLTKDSEIEIEVNY